MITELMPEIQESKWSNTTNMAISTNIDANG